MDSYLIGENSSLNRENSLGLFPIPDHKQIYDINDISKTDLFWENYIIDNSNAIPKSPKKDYTEKPYNDIYHKESCFSNQQINSIVNKFNIIEKIEMSPCPESKIEDFIYFNESIPKDKMMKIKRYRTKLLLEKTRPGIRRDFLESNQNLSEFSYKQKKINSERKIVINNPIDDQQNKILKNRISAQLSRDKKQIIFNEVKNQNLILTKENLTLKEQLVKKDKELENIKNKLNNLCNKCSSIYFPTPSASTNDIRASSHSSGKSCIKYGLVTSFIVLICLMCVFSDNGENNNQAVYINKPNNFKSKRNLNSYINKKFYCSKDNSTELETPSSIIFEYFIQNVSKLEPKNESLNYTYYHFFKLNTRKDLTHLYRKKISKNAKHYCSNLSNLTNNFTLSSNKTIKTKHLRKETNSEKICLKKNMLLNEIVIKCEDPDNNLLRGILLKDKFKDKNNTRSLIIMSDSEFNYLDRYISRIRNKQKIIENNQKIKGDKTFNSIHWSRGQ